MSRQDFEVTQLDLAIIQDLARRSGYIEAVRTRLNLPPFENDRLKERAHWHYVNGPSSFFDPYILERAWVLAIGEVLDIRFRFLIDLYVTDRSDLAKPPDNPK